MLGAAVLLEGCGIPWVGFPSEICSAVPCLARNVELSFPVFLFVGCRDKLRSHQLAAFGNQLGHPPTLLALCAPRAQPGSWSWDCGQCWELCCSSHTSPIPAGSSSSPSPALAPGRAPGAASVLGSHIPWEAEAQGPVQSGTSPTHQPHRPACAPSWGLSQALIFPSLCGNPGQGCQRRREEPSLLGRKPLLALAWECGGPRRLLSPGLALRSGPCTLPYLPQQD